MDSSKSFSSKAVKPKKENGIAALAAAGLSGRYIASNVVFLWCRHAIQIAKQGLHKQTLRLFGYVL